MISRTMIYGNVCIVSDDIGRISIDSKAARSRGDDFDGSRRPGCRGDHRHMYYLVFAAARYYDIRLTHSVDFSEIMSIS